MKNYLFKTIVLTALILAITSCESDNSDYLFKDTQCSRSMTDDIPSIIEYIKFNNDTFTLNLSRENALAKGISSEYYELWEKELNSRNKEVQQIKLNGGEYIYSNFYDSTAYNHFKPIRNNRLAISKSIQYNHNDGRDNNGWGPYKGQLIDPSWAIDTLYIQVGWNGIAVAYDLVCWDENNDFVTLQNVTYKFRFSGTHSNGTKASLDMTFDAPSVGDSRILPIPFEKGNQLRPHTLEFRAYSVLPRSYVIYCTGFCNWELI